MQGVWNVTKYSRICKINKIFLTGNHSIFLILKALKQKKNHQSTCMLDINWLINKKVWQMLYVDLSYFLMQQPRFIDPSMIELSIHTWFHEELIKSFVLVGVDTPTYEGLIFQFSMCVSSFQYQCNFNSKRPQKYSSKF